MAKHAKLGPSSTERWMNCPGSVPLSEGLLDESSRYAAEGTAAHFLAAYCLTSKTEPEDYKGREILLCVTPDGEHFEAFCPVGNNSLITDQFMVEDEMVRAIDTYVSDIRRVALAVNGDLHVEQRLSISHLTKEEDAAGTSDVVICAPDKLIVVDLKYGQGVRVEAEGNKQLLMYAAAAYEKFGLIYDFKSVQLVIHQPRLDAVSEYSYSLEELEQFTQSVKVSVENVTKAVEAYEAGAEDFSEYLHPSEDACRWCKAKAICPALADRVSQELGEMFEDLSEAQKTEEGVKARVESIDVEALSLKAKSIELIEMFCKAVRGKVESLLLLGIAVPDFKLVQGKKGHRTWKNAEEAEAMMRSMRLKEAEMYNRKLISPTDADKLLKKDSPKRWQRIVPLIEQRVGSPSVAPMSDKREALTMTHVADEMEDLTDGLLG